MKRSFPLFSSFSSFSFFSLETALLVLIVLGYLIVAGLFAIRTPVWQTPDEPAHYNYVRQVAENGCCPVIAMGDWDSSYLETLKSARFAPETLENLDSVQYEDHQPPLYYLLSSVVYRLTNGNLTALRLFSVAVGVIIVVCAYATGKTLLPSRPEIGLGAAAFVAFQPMHVAILASVNNDALGWALVALILWASVKYVADPTPLPPPRIQRGGNSGVVKPWHLGLLVGIGLLTKTTAYPMAGVAFLAIVMKKPHPPAPSPFGEGERLEHSPSDGEGEQSPSPGVEATQNRLKSPLRTRRGDLGVRLSRDPASGVRLLGVRLSLYLIPALALGSIWWLRNFSVYGVPDFLGLRAHDAVVIGQPRTAELIAQIGGAGYAARALGDTFNSFWGQFGWMALPLRGNASVDWIYPALLVVLIVAHYGVILDFAFSFRPEMQAFETLAHKVRNRRAWGLLILTAILAVLAYLYYNTVFLQFQGRYMFPLLIPMGLWLALGVDFWRRLLFGQKRDSITRWLTPLFFCAFAALDVWLLWTVIVPNLSPG